MSSTTIFPPGPIGVIGGGQLGRMFAQAAQRMGYRVVVLGGSADDPAAQVAEEVVVGLPDHPPALREFADRARAVTVEFENVSAPALRWLGRRMPARPGWKTVWVSQDRIREKTFLDRIGVPVAPWRPVRTHRELDQAVLDLGCPLILKTSSSGYDGKGQVRVSEAVEAMPAWARLGLVDCVAEAVVGFAAEVSVVVVRGFDGDSRTFPVFLNRHDRHILDTTLAPAPIGPVASMDARDLASRIAEALGTVGVLTVEFFLAAHGSMRVNELAPRPHNSGHLTIEAAATDQFEQQVRALCGLPLGPTDLRSPAAMANLLGDLWQGGEPDWADAMRLDPGVRFHLYGKRSAPKGRKMGHVTAIDDDPQSALARVLAARRVLEGDRGELGRGRS